MSQADPSPVMRPPVNAPAPGLTLRFSDLSLDYHMDRMTDSPTYLRYDDPEPSFFGILGKAFTSIS